MFNETRVAPAPPFVATAPHKRTSVVVVSILTRLLTEQARLSAVAVPFVIPSHLGGEEGGESRPALAPPSEGEGSSVSAPDPEGVRYPPTPLHNLKPEYFCIPCHRALKSPLRGS